MTNEEKQLLLIDLCARLPYGVKIMFSHNGFRWDWEQTLDEIAKCDDGEYSVNGWGIHGIKPYLRPLSSMTDEECELYHEAMGRDNEALAHDFGDFPRINFIPVSALNFLLSRHFDFRGLIPMGLALEAPKDMYKTE